jgi:two-component system, sporulation sensor kinase E
MTANVNEFPESQFARGQPAGQIDADIGSILDHVSDGFIALDTQFRFIYANAEAERILDKSRDQLLGNCVYDIFPDFVGSIFDREYKRALSFGVKVEFESHYEPLDRWFEVHAHPSRDSLTVFFRDVTTRHNADEALRAGNERFNLAQKAAGMATWDWDIQSGQLAWSSNAPSLYGTHDQRFAPSFDHWMEQVLPADRVRVNKALRNAFDRKSDYDTEFRIQWPDGTIRWLAARGQFLCDEHGNPVRMLGVNLDITTRKQTEDALTLSEQTYHSLFDTMTQGVIYFDAFARVISANPAAERILGVPLEELLGRTADNVWTAVRESGTPFPPNMHPALVALETAREVKNIVLGVYNAKEDQQRWIKVDAVPQIRPGEMFPFQVYAILDDITERKRSQEIMRVSEKLAATGRLAASIAHEINNPLESITNILYLLENDPALHDPARNYASMAQQELSRVTHIARQTLGFYRDTSSPIPVDIPSLLDNVIELYQRKIAVKAVNLIRQYDVGQQVPAFPGELRQVFSNLILNAIESVAQGGTVRLHVFASPTHSRQRDRGIHVIIADSGPGISFENRKKIFEPFFTTKGEKGTGLGLWVSHGIVEKHGGTIRFRSSIIPGRSGTVFSVFLPLKNEHHSEGTTAA